MRQFLFDRSKKSSIGSYFGSPEPQPDPLDEEEWEIPPDSEIFDLDVTDRSGAPSALGQSLTAKPPSSTTSASGVAAVSKNLGQQPKPSGGPQAFAFDTQSRDDQILDAKKQALQRKGPGSTPSSSSTTTTSSSSSSSKPSPGAKKPATPKQSPAASKVASKPASSSPLKQATTQRKGPAGPSSSSSPFGADDLRKSTGTPGRTNRVVKQRNAAQQKAFEQALGDAKTKGHINLVTIGHVDAGKSTLMGHLLFELGFVDKKTMHRYEKDSRDSGKGSFAFAWVMDAEGEERERGVTIDVSVCSFFYFNH